MEKKNNNTENRNTDKTNGLNMVLVSMVWPCVFSANSDSEGLKSEETFFRVTLTADTLLAGRGTINILMVLL